MKKTPVQSVKEGFSSKEKLVEAVQKLAQKDLWIDRVNEQKGLGRVSNAKLLRLHTILTAVKKDFGSRAKLIDAILSLEKRAKDTGYKTRLEKYPLPRLVDIHQAATRRAKRASPKAPARKKAKSAAASA